MGTLASRIENHLKRLLQSDRVGVIEIRRCDLAQRFDCVPSQINYVLQTRFSPDKGYFVESRRGGGGYIRITRTTAKPSAAASSAVYRQIGRQISEEEAEEILIRLLEAGAIDQRRATLIRVALRRETAWLDRSMRPVVRATLLRAILLVVLQDA